MNLKVGLFLLIAALFASTVEAATSLTVSSPGFTLKQDTSTPDYDSIRCAANFSLYRGLFKQWKGSDYTNTAITGLIEPWNWVFKNCPSGFEHTFIDGIKIMQYRIESEDDPTSKAKNIDSLMLVYDQYSHYFPTHLKTGKSQVGSISGLKGVDLYTYNEDRYMEAYTMLKKSVETDGNNTDGTVMIYYLRSVIKMARNGMADSVMIIDVYNRVSEVVNSNINGFTLKGDNRMLETYRNYKINIDATFEPFSNCNILVGIYKNELAKSHNDIVLLKKVIDFLKFSECQTDSLYINACYDLYHLAPGPETAYNIGWILLNDNKPDEALPFFEKASKSTDLKIAQTSFKTMGEIFRTMKNFPFARQMALKAIELNPNDGAPYITIGNLYASSAKDCGSDEFTSRVAYWTAVDKFLQAQRIDPSVAEDALKLITGYSASFPSKETIRSYGLKEGGSYRVECWFTEETIIKTTK